MAEVPLDEDITQPWHRAIGAVSLSVSKTEVPLDFLGITPVNCDPFRVTNRLIWDHRNCKTVPAEFAGGPDLPSGVSVTRSRTRCRLTPPCARRPRRISAFPARQMITGGICPGRKGSDRHLHCMVYVDLSIHAERAGFDPTEY